jgi:hypothetical protein
MVNGKANIKGKFDAALSVVRTLITIAASSALLVLFIIDFSSICSASQKLLARAGSVTTLKILGIELSIDEQMVSAALSEYAERPNRLSAEVSKIISRLQPSEYVRLMEIGQLDGLCEFEKPSAKMRADVALDYELDEKGLAKIVDSPKTVADVAAYLDRKTAEGSKTPNGRPLSCYDMSLTDLGRDVKTALVQSLKSAFNHMPWRGKPPAESHPVESHKVATL